MDMIIKNETLMGLGGSVSEKVIVPYGVKYIAAEAFKGCKNLVSVTIPDSVEEIEPCAFEGCTSLSEINVPDGSELLEISDLTDTKWYHDNKDGFLILGGTLLEYGGKCDDITVPAGVKRIAQGVFSHIGWSAVVRLPSTVAEIPDGIFADAWEPIVTIYDV